MSSNNVWHLITKIINTLQHSATLHYTSPHFTQLHFTTLRYTSPHFTQLHFTSSHLHFTILSFSFTHLHYKNISRRRSSECQIRLFTFYILFRRLLPLVVYVIGFVVSKISISWTNTSVCTDPGMLIMDLTRTNCFDCCYHLLPTPATSEHIMEHIFLTDTNFKSVSCNLILNVNIMSQAIHLGRKLTNTFCHKIHL